MAYESNSWATFGKTTAGIVGVCAVGGALYGIGAHIYKEGYNDGIKDTQQSEEKKQETKLEQMKQDGLLISESSCLRFKSYSVTLTDSRIDERLITSPNCNARPLEIAVRERYNATEKPRVEHVKTSLENLQTEIGSFNGVDTPTIKASQRTAELWNPYKQQ